MRIIRKIRRFISAYSSFATCFEKGLDITQRIVLRLFIALSSLYGIYRFFHG